jgi:hypothetical protein
MGVMESMGDLAAARQFALDIQAAMMQVSHTTRVDNLDFRTLTNLGLKLLFFDEIAKRDSKQDLFGEFCNDINRALLQLEGRQPEDCEVLFGDVLPVDEQAETAALQFDLQAGIVSKETLMEKRDYDPATEQERMQKERVNTGNAGAEILRQFIGRGQTGA